jgi:hypothetical protein
LNDNFSHGENERKRNEGGLMRVGWGEEGKGGEERERVRWLKNEVGPPGPF